MNNLNLKKDEKGTWRDECGEPYRLIELNIQRKMSSLEYLQTPLRIKKITSGYQFKGSISDYIPYRYFQNKADFLRWVYEHTGFARVYVMFRKPAYNKRGYKTRPHCVAKLEFTESNSALFEYKELGYGLRHLKRYKFVRFNS